MQKNQLKFGLYRILSDFIAVLLANFLVYKLRYDWAPSIGKVINHDEIANYADFLAQTYLITPVAVIIFALIGLYSFSNQKSLLTRLSKYFAANLIIFSSIVTYYFLIRDFPVSRLAIIYFPVVLFALNTSFNLIIHALAKRSFKANVNKERTIIIGSAEAMKKVTTKLSNEPRFNLVSQVTTITDLKERLDNDKIQTIIQIGEECDLGTTEFCLNIARSRHLNYHLVPSKLSLVEHNFTAENIQGLLMLNLQKTPLTGWGRINKRLFDFSISLVALTILAPFFLIIAAAIKLESKGTVFFRYLDDGKVATRIGQSGKHFYCYKFRSMKANTHNHRYQELSDQNQRSGPIVKIKNDPRITKIGKLLRRFDFDELPQLINVLIGNMSLVGPRPHLPEEVSKYDENARFVLTIKPGITGMAQVSGRSSLNFDDEIKLDTYYIEHWSLLLDIKILLKTIPAVIFKKAD